MSSQSSRSNRRWLDRLTLGNLLHPGEWRNMRARSRLPSAAGTTTPGTGNSISPVHSNHGSRSPSPMARPGSPDLSIGTHVAVSNTTPQAAGATSGGPSISSEGNAWTRLERALQALRVTTRTFSPLYTALGELLSCLHMFEAAAKNHRDYDELAIGLEGMVKQLARHLDETGSEVIIDTITSIVNAIQKEIGSIDGRQSRSLPRRIMGASSTEDDLIRRYRRIEQLFRQLQGEASMSTWNTVDELRMEQYLKDLRPAKLARFNSELSAEVSRRGCTKHTRTTILEDSARWSEEPNLAKVYWMNGMAGTGKTTIAYTLCERLEAGKQLAASFFCTRASPECREAKRIIPTIAYQLARRFAPFRHSLCQQLKQDPDISTGQLSDQFDLLLKQPLMAAKDKLSNNLVIVVDALDECNDYHMVELFLDMLFRSVMELPVKFFVTSRPEPAIRNKMLPESERSRSILYLHEIERSLVQADIELYLRDELASISPVDKDITQLALNAGSLFIYAATAVRHIRPVGKAVNSKGRLKAILTVGTQSTITLSTIDTLYTAILTDALNDQDLSPEERNQMRLVLHTAICACEPMLIRTLSTLSGLEDKDNAIAALQPLRSVLHVSDHSEFITTLHGSFSDFMFDHKRSGGFYCDKADHNRFLLESCLRVMKAQLRFNICSIPSSFVPNNQVPELGEQIATSISDELFYACRFWVDHLRKTDPRLAPLLLVNDFMSQRLLFWMEVMSLKNCMTLGMMVITKLNTWLFELLGDTHTDLLELVSDAQAFVAMYASSAASAYTPHIYLSALPLTSLSSAVRSQYLPRFKGLIKVSGTSLNRIGRATLGVWTSKRSICSSVFSPDGDHLVLGDEEGAISVRNTYDGTYVVRPFKAHEDAILSLGISSDSRQIVSGSSDMKLSVWSIYDGTLAAGPFKGHTGRVNSVAFSPKAALIVSGSDDHTVGLCDLHNVAVHMRFFTGHKRGVESVVFSPNGSLIVSGSADHTIRVWDVSSGTSILILEGHESIVSFVMFSPEEAHIISGSYDGTVRIWNTSDWTPSSPPLKIGQIILMAISPDGDRVVSGADNTICVWNTHTGTLMAGPFEGHTDIVRSINFSGDGVRIVSTSEDQTIRLWNSRAQPRTEQNSMDWFRGVVVRPTSPPSQTHLALCDQTNSAEIHVWDLRTIVHVAIPTGEKIQRLQFSPDGTRIHSLHSHCTIRTWDTQTARLLEGPHRCSLFETWHSVACSMDGTRVVFCNENTIRLWHIQPNRIMILCDTILGRLQAAFSQDGSRCVTSTYSLSGFASKVWDAESGICVAGPFQFEALAISFDGTYLCYKGSSASSEVINTHTGVQTSMQAGLLNMIFTPDGLHVAGRVGRTTQMRDMLGQIIASATIPSLGSNLACFNILGCSSDGWLLLSYDRDRGNYICRTRISYPPFAFNPDGWILNHQEQPLFWVPAEIRKDFPGCSGVVISGCVEVLLRVDYDDILVGDDWSQCYVPNTHSM
ncbi:unnamed protein product [Rhizoctonia solani]|uniref:NACHT domain-containing protein n=1 Tax=Rhizoctonia solani TaxID=456999 RepID=A0A8H3E587_9AGAM|nr:unnamed protein product [Rhizoctonia solani]